MGTLKKVKIFYFSTFFKKHGIDLPCENFQNIFGNSFVKLRTRIFSNCPHVFDQAVKDLIKAHFIALNAEGRTVSFASLLHMLSG